MNAVLTRPSVAEPYHVLVTSHTSSHNHPLAEDIRNQYPDKRLQLSAAEEGTVHMLRKSGVSNAKIHKFIIENTSSEPSAKDVSTLILKRKRDEEEGTTVKMRLHRYLQQYMSKDDTGSVGRVFVDSTALDEFRGHQRGLLLFYSAQ